MLIHNAAYHTWNRGKPSTLKNKTDFGTNSRSSRPILLLLSLLLIFGLAHSSNGALHTTYYVNDYNVLNGTYVNGTVPGSIQQVDSDYFRVRSSPSSTYSSPYNSSGYNLLGSTTLDSGSLSNLTADDGVHMNFSSYSSGPDIQDYVDNNTSDIDNSTDIGTHSNFTAQQYGPDSVNDTLTEGNIGTIDTLWLYVNTDDGNKTGWTRVGINPYLNATDYPTNFVNASGNNLNIGDFGFADSEKSMETINNVEVQIYAKQSGIGNRFTVWVWDGSSWTASSKMTIPTSWNWLNWTATSILDTWTKIDAAEIYICSDSAAGTYEVDCARLKVDYTGLANYELDLEVQWTNVDYDELNEELCLYGGSMSAENVRVDVWNGSSWANLFTDLNSGWNNVSVTSYLTSANLTIRFKGGTESGDTTQDTWNIDTVLLHVWTEQYTIEVEFTGTSNTGTWTQLNWTIDSAWDTANVSVTIQLYNYSSGTYPTGGDGYINYTSSSTADTDENKNQTITTHPEDFRDSSDSWKLKVKGIKPTSTPFKFKADWIQLKPTYYSEYTDATEFIFSSMTTKTPTQLNLTIVSLYDIASVNVTIQVYNYTSASYPVSGEGYLNYMSSSIPNTDETKQLNITTNPEDFISNGNATVKITGTLSTTTQYQQEINHLKLIYGYANSPPLLNPIGDKSVYELSLLNFTATASDPDAPPQNLTFSIGPGAPSGANITVDGYFTWTPTEAQGPSNYTVRIVVSDGSLTDYEDIWVVVHQVPLHDVAVMSVTASSYDIVSGEVVRVTVVVRNQGSEIETFNVTAFCNETVIETETVVNLAAGDQKVLEFLWNTTGLAEAGYKIRAEASFVSGETETSNNVHWSGILQVNERTLWQPFDWSRNLWYILLACVGLLLVFGLERRRRKKARPPVEKQIDEFSQQFGMTHEQIKGKKMLLEIDPTSDDHTGLLSFISEAKNHNELLFILTNRNSTLHSALSGDPDVEFLLLTSETSSPLQINERENLLPASDLSVLLDHLGNIAKIETKKTINVLFSNLSNVILRCGFKETYKFMRLLLETISSSKVTALIVFNPTAHDNAISSSIRGMLQKEIPRSN